VARLAQNEMKAKGATPLRVRLTDGLGVKSQEVVS